MKVIFKFLNKKIIAHLIWLLEQKSLSNHAAELHLVIECVLGRVSLATLHDHNPSTVLVKATQWHIYARIEWMLAIYGETK